MAWRGKQHEYFAALHASYGSVVRIGTTLEFLVGDERTMTRTGPNDLSVTDKDLFPQILGSQGMPKGPGMLFHSLLPGDSILTLEVWDNRRVVTSRSPVGHRNLHAVRDLKFHGELRKPWNKAFAKEPLKDYEVVLKKTVSTLVEQLQELCKESSKGVVTDGAGWLSYYSLVLVLCLFR